MAGAVAFALVVPALVLALRAEGYHATKVNLNDAGIWVVNWQRGTIGRINTQIGVIEVALAAPSKSFDIAQVDDTVLVNVPEQKNMVPVDVGQAALGQPSAIPADAKVQLGGPTGTVSDPVSGKLWATTRARIAQLDVKNEPPRFEAGAKPETVVGADGTVYAYSPNAGEVHITNPEGDSRTVGMPAQVESPKITVVGDQVVVLDQKAAKVVVPGQAIVDLGGKGDKPVLQQAGPAGAEVIVATDDGVLAVPLTGGTIRTVTTGGTRGAVAPVVLGGCVFAAWSGTPRYSQTCPGKQPLSENVSSMKAGSRLEFRVNRNRVVLNDSATGANLLFTDDKPVEITNWDEALNKDKKDQESKQEIVEKDRSQDCDADTTPAELKPDRVGTRPGRPVLVSVLDNDQFPRCEVPIVEVPNPPAPEAATVAVVREGTAVQVTPGVDATAPITFPYQVNTTRGGQTADITVEVAAAGQNTKPVANPDTTNVVAGKNVRHNVLVNDSDPEGDALTLTKVELAEDGSFTFRADGEISYTAPGGSVGTKSVTYWVQDELGEEAEGKLEVNVTSAETNIAPNARTDRVSAFVGRETTVNLLANDSDANGDPLQISTVEQPPDLETKWDTKGELRVKPSRAGSWVFSYSVTDGEKEAKAQIRVDASEPGPNRPPVAVRDDVSARPGIPAFADLVANDHDEDGDMLAVVGIDVPPDSGIAVELLDMHLVRVTAPAGFKEPTIVRYTVSDGAAIARGVLVVRPYRTAGVDQPPIAVDDEASVRAANITALPVLENDVDPEGERLTLTRVDALPPTDGQVFIEGDQLRYQAPPTGPATVRLAYTAEDPAGNRADGQVVVRVVPTEQINQPPRGPLLDARVFAGAQITIPVPLVGLDPDGDPVAVVGVTEPPLKGHAVAIAEGFTYRADRGASGTDTFAFSVRDSLGLESTGRVRIAVVPKPTTNSSPVAVPDRKPGRPGSTVILPVLANDSDPDGDPLALLTDGKDAPTKPRLGDVKVDADGKRLLYEIPASAPPGDMSFTYGITDGRGGSARGIVTVTIESADAKNKPPVARDDLVKPQAPGATVEVDVLANDIDPDGEGGALQVVVVTGGVDATVTGDRKVRVKVGDRSVALVYEITDVGGATARAVVSVPVFDDRAPDCKLKTVDVKAGESISVDVLGSCTDPTGRDLEMVKVLAARGGTVQRDGNKAVFTSAAEVRGDAGFSYVVSNGTTTAVGGVIVQVAGQNFPPEFAGTSVEVPAGGDRQVDLAALVTDLNPEDRHTFSQLEGVNGKIEATLAGSTLRVRSSDDAKGATASLSLKVSDGVNEIAGQVSVEVLAHDGQPPAAVDDQIETFQEKPVTIDVTANDVDPLGKGLTVSVSSQNSGQAEVVDGKSIRFTPQTGFFGEASITYEISDAAKDTDRRSSATARVNVIGRPSKPAAPTGKRDSKLVRLEWGAPQANGAPITEYIVENDKGVRKTTTSNSLVFDGLENGTQYRFRVAARNKAVETDEQVQQGFSDSSAILIPDKAPGTPASPVLTFGDQAIKVKWTAPANEGTAITNYQVRVSGSDHQETRDMGTKLETDWTPLTNGVSYTFSVRAKNDADYGEWSLASNDPVNAIPAAEPGPVPKVEADRLDKDTSAGGWVQVTWGTPVDNGDAKFTFKITASPADIPEITISDAATRSRDIGGLRNGVNYTFTITATNKAGTGPSGTSGIAVPAALPSAPAAPDVTPADRSVVATFDAPASNGEAISSWEASANGSSFTPANGGSVSQGPSAQVSVTVSGLVNGTNYTIRVRACNDVGCGSPSPISATVNPFGPPGTPSVSASVAGNTITWNWTTPSGNGRTITGYSLWLDGVLLTSSHGSTSWARGFGAGETHVLAVAANTDGPAQGASGSAQASTPPQPSAAVTKSVEVPPNKDCTLSPCFRFHLTMRNFTPGTTYDLQCANASGVFWPTSGNNQRRTTDGNGSFDGDLDCYYGFSNTIVYVNVVGVMRTPDYRWP